MASETSALSSGSWNEATQFGTTTPLRCGPAQLPGICLRADSGMISSPTGACLIAQLAKVRHTVAPNKTRLFICSRVLVKLPNKPVELCGHPQENFAHDVDHLAVGRVNGASPAGPGSKKKLAVFGRENEAHGNALFRCGYG
jgi:hypothetical protein